jgi:cystathionine beta-lyase
LAEGVTSQQYFLERARGAQSEGLEFGEAGRGHVRLNSATSAEILEEILDRLDSALT